MNKQQHKCTNDRQCNGLYIICRQDFNQLISMNNKNTIDVVAYVFVLYWSRDNGIGCW